MERLIEFHSEKQSFDIEKFKKVLKIASWEIFIGRDPVNVIIKVVSKIPQERNGRLDYLIASGLAIELYTKAERRHRDIDLVVVNSALEGEWHALKADVRTANDFWCQMCFSNDFLTSTAQKIPLKVATLQGVNALYLVHPAIIFVQKASNHESLPPRNKEIRDLQYLIQYYQASDIDSREWSRVTQFSILALPFQERETTMKRIRELESVYNISLL